MKKTLFLTFLSYMTHLICVAQHLSEDHYSADEHFGMAEKYLIKATKYDSAIYHYELARHKYEEKEEFGKYTDCLNKISTCLYKWNQLDQSLIKANEALGEAKVNVGEKNIQIAQAYYNISRVYYLRAEYGASFEYLAKAQTLLTELSGDGVKGVSEVMAETYGGMGDIFYMLDKYHQARNQYLEQQKLVASLNNPLHTAFLHYKFGNVYKKQGHYHLALEEYQKATKIYEKHVNKKHTAMADCFVGIGDVRKHYGSYDIATEFYYKALSIYQQIFGKTHPKAAEAYLGLSEIFKNQGNYNEALHHYRKVVSIYKQNVGEDHPTVSEAYLGIGNVHTYRTEYQPALNYYRKALKINEKMLATHRISTSAAYNNIGGIYYFNGDYEQASQHYKMALSIDKELHGEKHPDVANAYGNMGQLYAEQGQYDKALEFCQKAICASVTNFHSTNIYKNPYLENYFDQNDLLWYLRFKAETLERVFIQNKNVIGLEASLQTYQLCDSLIDKIRVSHTSKQDKIELGKTAATVYAGATKTAHELLKIFAVQDLRKGENLQTRQKYFLDEIFYFSEKNKAGVLAASIVETNAKAFGGIPKELLEEEMDLREDIADYRKELAKNPDSLTTIFYRNHLFEANKKYRALIHRFETQYPKYHKLKHDLHPVSADDIRQKLDKHTAMVSYFFTDNDVYVISLTKDTIAVKHIENNLPVKKAVRRMRNGIFYKVAKVYAGASFEIYDMIFPVLPDSIKNVIIIPDGIAVTIPFESLLSEKANPTAISNKQYKDFPFLIKKYNVSYAFSGNLFYSTFFEHKSVSKPSRDWLGIAPVFTQTAKINQKSAQVLTQLQEKSGQGGSLYRDGAVTPIPATEHEIHTIAEKFLAKNQTIEKRLHQNAQESFVKLGGLQYYRYLHIATHGFANSENPELSGILLMPDSLEDGILYSGEIYNLNLNADLTVLSACETGLGKIFKGEGVIGLTRALLYAGTKNIMVSLWKVSDASTSELMIQFYETLPMNPQNSEASGENVFNFSNALRTSKLKMIQSENFSSPYYWSPFVLIGK